MRQSVKGGASSHAAQKHQNGYEPVTLRGRVALGELPKWPDFFLFGEPSQRVRIKAFRPGIEY